MEHWKAWGMTHERRGKVGKLQIPQHDWIKILNGLRLEENKAREAGRHQIMEGNMCQKKR